MKKTITLFALAIILGPIVVRSQNINTVAGTPSSASFGGDGGQATNAQLDQPYDVKLDASGNMYISDNSNYRLRKVTAGGIISTFAGNGTLGFSGDGGQATAAEMSYPGALGIDASGNVYFGDNLNNVVRKITPAGIITTVAGNHLLGGGYSGDGGQATAAELDGPQAVVFDKNGNMYIPEYGNNVVRKVSVSGVITTIAGNQLAGNGYSGDGGQATDAELDRPEGIAFDASGNMYIADGQNDVIRKVNTSGIISTYAGIYPGGNFSGDGGQATAAELSYPIGIVIDGGGYMYIADQDNHVVRMVNPSGIISTVAGNNTLGNGYSGDGGPATAAELSFPTGLSLDASNLLYIADEENDIIRKVSTPLAVTEVHANSELHIYPNPASNMVYVQLKNASGNINLSLYNMIGQQVITKSAEANKNINFSVEGLSEGTYLLKVQCEDGSTMLSKIAVTR